jgi:hypothetical protein
MKLTRMSAAAALTALLAVTPAVADKGGVPNGGNGNGKGNGNAAQPATPASPGDPGNGAQPATPAEPAAKKAKGAKKSHPAKPAHPAKAARPAKQHPAKPAKPAKSKGSESSAPAAATPPANPHAKAGKTTICHSTGSETNPFVTITISDNALKAHARHHGGRDIIPAPAGGCPAPAAAATEPAAAQEVTGSGDATTSTTETPAVTDTPVTTQLSEPIGLVRGASGSATPVPAAIASAPQATDEASGPATAAVSDTLPVAETTDSRGIAGLPFTGLDLAIVVLAGIAALLAGFALRRAVRQRRLTA